MSWHISKALLRDYENSHCSRELVAESLEDTCSDGKQSARSNTTPTPEAYYWPDKTTEHSRLSRFGMTSELLTEGHGEALLTWFLAGSHAKTSAQLEKAMDWMASEVGCGRKWLGLLARYDHDSRSWKTPQCSLVEGLDEFSETWPRWGSMRNGESWEREILGLPIVVNESGFLPTPRASVGTHGICWKRAKDGNHRSQIEDYLGWLSLKNGGQVTPGRTVNAEFQDWLMEWPSQWTDLKPLGTGKFPEWQQQHSVY